MSVKTDYDRYPSSSTLLSGNTSDSSKKIADILSQKYNKMILVSYNLDDSDETVLKVIKFLIPHIKEHFNYFFLLGQF